MSDGAPTGVQQALAEIRDLQSADPYKNTTFYIFSGTQWLAGGVFYNDVPPFWYDWYIDVPPLHIGQPLFIYGADSSSHPQAGKVVNVIRYLIDTGQMKWLE